MQAEHQIQKTVFDWVRVAEKVYPVLRLAFAVPNAGKRTYKIAAMLKAEGMRKGVLDTFFPFSRQGYTGLVIEFKKPGGKLSPVEKLTPEQAEYREMLLLEGWKVEVLDDAEAAILCIKQYLGIR